MEDMVLLRPLPIPTFCREGRKDFIALRSSLVARDNEQICVTGGNSLLGSHIVKELLRHGYLVRVTIENQVDLEDLRKLITEEEMNMLESVVVAKMQDLGSLCDAFRGCHAVFHTSASIDPHGVSGYSEKMALLETEGARNVIEACGRAAYARRCIFTSSLLASVWTGNNPDRVINEKSWTNEEFCIENKLWLALGKTKAEKVAWRKSEELKVKLLVVCPGLLIESSFPYAHKETSLPYLKGGSIMLQRGLLAIADIKEVAQAHVRVYEAMISYGAYGRYLCFERVVTRLDEAIALENELKINGMLSGARSEVLSDETQEVDSNLCNSKLTRLLSQASRTKSCNE